MCMEPLPLLLSYLAAVFLVMSCAVPGMPAFRLFAACCAFLAASCALSSCVVLFSCLAACAAFCCAAWLLAGFLAESSGFFFPPGPSSR